MSSNSLQNRNDIGYFDFMKYSEAIGDKTAKQVIDITMSYFGVGVFEFANALENRPENVKTRFKINSEFKTAGDFIDVDTYLTEENALELFKKVLTKKHFWNRKYKAETISLMESDYVLGFFLKSSAK